MRAVLILGGCLIGGCSSGDDAVEPIDKDTFLMNYPALFCDREMRCDAEGFEASFGSELTTCVQEMGLVVETRINAEDCNFDGQQAAECVVSLDEGACQDWSGPGESNSSSSNPCQLSAICRD